MSKLRAPGVRVAATLAAAALLVGAAGGGTGASSSPYAPLDQRGPKLGVPAAKLKASLQCNGPLRGSTRQPILLVPGTTMTPHANFSWNYERAFDRLGWRWCALTLPKDATGDIQRAGQYVVAAVRKMSRKSKQKVDILGWSQGGMVPRWALRFWPDTRALVDDLVGLSPSNHGTAIADARCQRSCTPANWQQASVSDFTMALNSRAETFAGISYTVAYSYTDEIVLPNAGPSPSSALRTGRGSIANIAVQDICPTSTADHFAIGTYDPVGYAIVVDALTQRGPAVASRIPVTTCLQTLQPGVDPVAFPGDYAAFLQYAGSTSGDAAEIPAEPALGRYVFVR